MATTEREILPGIRLRVIETDRFKTCSFSAAFLCPLDARSASMNALVPRVLRRGCARLPDMTQIARELEELYGAMIEPFARKQGDVQVVGLVCDFVDGQYAEDPEMFKHMCNLAAELLLDPVLEDGSFRREYVESELANLLDELRAEQNEKLQYAYRQALSKLFEGQSFGVSATGDEAQAKRITRDSLQKAYVRLVKTAPLLLTYCGSESFEKVAEITQDVFAPLSRAVVNGVTPSAPAVQSETIECVDVMDVNQTVLLLGMQTGQADRWAMEVLATVLGGGTASKLFLNVRERESLCYYTGTVYDRNQDTMFLYAGVDAAQTKCAIEKMLEEYRTCAAGRITEEELTQAKYRLVDRLKTIKDSPTSLLFYWIDRMAVGESRTPSETARALHAVTREQAIEAAGACELKILYRLTGEEGNCGDRNYLPETQRT